MKKGTKYRPLCLTRADFQFTEKKPPIPNKFVFFLGDSESYVAAEAYLTYLWSLWIHFSYLSPFPIMYSVANHYRP